MTMAGQALTHEPRANDGGGLVDFFDLPRDELAGLLERRFDAPAYRARQLIEWVYKKGVVDFAAMSNLAKHARRELEGVFTFPVPTICERQVSSDGTRKYLFEFAGGDRVEAVMIKQPARMTLCVSSQVGCGMGCTFCRTAAMRLKRNLRASEILQQVRGVIEDAKKSGDMFDSIVFMGMGEPLHNFEGVCRALRILRDQFAFDFSGKKITVSSAGLVPAIERFAQTGIDAHLAISLNATSEAVRSQIMPVNKSYPLAVLLRCLKAFPLKNRRKITIEYVMLHGVNDTAEDLKRLPKLLHGIPVKVNLIPYNENAGLGYHAPPREQLDHWHDQLMRAGINCTIRWSKGQDISAACGQLAVR